MSDRTRRLVVMLAAAGLLAAACGNGGGDGDDDGSATGAPAPTETAAPGALATTTAPVPAGPPDDPAGADGTSVEVTAVDYAYEGLPDRVPAGTVLTLANESTTELHELVAFALDGAEARPADALVALPEEELGALFTGPPATVLLASPASPAEATIVELGGTLVEPGRYLVFCGIPIGADPAAYLQAVQGAAASPFDVPGGPPHFTRGMYADLVVDPP